MAERGWHDEDAPRIEPAAGGPADGAYAAIAPDPERDSRRDAYRERERRRAARTLDRYIEIIIGDAGRPSALTEHAAVSAAGERFVEAMADYMRSWARTGTYDSHHKSHYGAFDPYADVEQNRQMAEDANEAGEL